MNLFCDLIGYDNDVWSDKVGVVVCLVCAAGASLSTSGGVKGQRAVEGKQNFAYSVNTSKVNFVQCLIEIKL